MLLFLYIDTLTTIFLSFADWCDFISDISDSDLKAYLPWKGDRVSVLAFSKEKKRKDGEDDRRSAIAESIRSRIDVSGTAHNYTDVIRTSGDVTYLIVARCFSQDNYVKHFVWKQEYKTLWNIIFFFVSMITRLLSHRTIFPRIFDLLCIPLDFQEKPNITMIVILKHNPNT